jgi:hypothetical protein
MKHTHIAAAVAFALIGCGIAGVRADESKISLRVKVGDAAESRLTVVEGHKAQLRSPDLDLELVPTVLQDVVMLSLTLNDADKKVVATPRLKGRFGEQMKLVLRPESSSPMTVLVTPERIN